MNTSPKFTNVTVLRPDYLFKTEQAAHDAMMLLAVEVVREIVAAGGKPPSPKRFDRDTRVLWEIWRLFVYPRGKHGTSSGTTQ